ncbi:MAG: hypothetical protein NTY09_05305 [bacterium]|nr:hypothetical protein [bacterium]
MNNARLTFLILLSVLITAICASPAPARDIDGIPETAIITPPAVDEGIYYFFSWPDHFYAFNETANELQWASILDPPAGNIAPQVLPAPAPEPIRSYILLHVGRRLWGISKVDGHPVWSVDGLPEGSYTNSNRASNRLPGFYTITNAAIL